MAKKTEKPDDTTPAYSDTLLVRTAHGTTFWRGGILFNGDWQTVKRAEVGETAWQRIIAEPILQTKQAA